MKTNCRAIGWATALCWALAVNSAGADGWHQAQAGTNRWSSLACSADGSKLFACSGSGQAWSYPGTIWVSTNAAASWTRTMAPTNYWCGLAASADGQKVVAIIGSGAVRGGIYTSADGGTTWISNNVPVERWVAITCSADGSRLYALADITYGMLFTSTNFGTSWNSNGLVQAEGPGPCLACSADGRRVLLVGAGIFTSTNYGAWWPIYHPNLGPGGWGGTAAACSADGRTMAVVDGNGAPDGHILTTTNYGGTWATNPVPPLSWQIVSVSADETCIMAAAWYSSGLPTGPVYTSTNSGATWTSNAIPNITWSALACSADGGRLFACSVATNALSFGQGQIWAASEVLPPRLDIQSSNLGYQLAWTVPSTNFVLQASTDLRGWSDVTNAPALNLTNLHNQVIWPSDPPIGFFRLTTP